MILAKSVTNYILVNFMKKMKKMQQLVFVQDETNENIFIYVSNELNVDYDTLFADSIEDAKHQIEEMLIDHWNEEIDYLENRIKSFQDEE